MKKSIAFFKDHLEIISVIGTIILTLVYGSGYMYMRGAYDFWNIPYEYIVVNSDAMVLRFVLISSIVIIVCIISIKMIQYIQKHGTSPLKKLWTCLYLYVIGCFGMAMILFIKVSRMCSIREMSLYVIQYPLKFCGSVAYLAFVVLLCFYGMGFLVKMLIHNANENDVKKMLKKEKIQRYIFLLAFVVVYILGGMYIIYDCGRAAVSTMQEITVATIQGKEYFVIGTYEDKWIVKKCVDTEEGWKIDNSQYMFYDLSGIPLEKWRLNVGDSVNNHVLNIEKTLDKKFIKNNEVEVNAMGSLIKFCNENEGFFAAILSVLSLMLSSLAIIMTYKVGKMPFNKNIKMISDIVEQENEFYIDLLLINNGNATICVRHIDIANTDGLNIGMLSCDELIVLKPCEYVKKRIRLYDDLENIKENRSNLNGHIVITVSDADNKKFITREGFSVG